MAVGTFRVGQRLRFDEDSFRIMRDLGNGAVVLESLQSGRMLEKTIPDLLRAWKDRVLVFEGQSQRPETPAATRVVYEDAFKQAYPEEVQAIARAKLKFVTELRQFPRTGSIMTPIIEELWGNKALWKGIHRFPRAPHFTTVAKWTRIYDDAGQDIRALVDRDFDKGKEVERIQPEVRRMVDDAIELEYLTEERPSLKELWRRLKGQVAIQNATRLPSEALRRPSYDYLKSCIQKLDAYDVYRARYGQRAADIKFRAAGLGPHALHPLARACMDHTRLDLFVVDEETSLPLGRPWLTLVLDEHARYVLGYYLGFEPPSSVSMTRALRHAIAPKDLYPEVENTWDAWGVMDLLIVDQALEFHGKVLEHGGMRYGINTEYCPRRKPWYKGKIERYFGTLGTGLLSNLKGKTFSSIDLRGDYDPAKHAVITLGTLKKIIQIWIVDVYHQEIHRGLGTSPRAAWEDGMLRGGEDGAPVDRYLPPASIEVESAFSASKTRSLTHKGIELDSLYYNSPELGALREAWGAEMRVEVRIQDDDLGSIIVVANEGKTLIRVPALDQDYAAGLTRWQHSVCKRYRSQLQEDDDREIGLLEAKNLIRALIQEDMLMGGKKSKTRVRQQRFLEGNGSKPNGAKPDEKQTESDSGDNKPKIEKSIAKKGNANTKIGKASANDDIPDFDSHKTDRRKAA